MSEELEKHEKPVCTWEHIDIPEFFYKKGDVYYTEQQVKSGAATIIK